MSAAPTLYIQPDYQEAVERMSADKPKDYAQPVLGYTSAPAQDKTQENPMHVQVGGNHYKTMKIQPMEFSMANRLDACQHTIIKYVTRNKGDLDKRLEDLDKAIHTIQMYKMFLKTK